MSSPKSLWSHRTRLRIDLQRQYLTNRIPKTHSMLENICADPVLKPRHLKNPPEVHQTPSSMGPRRTVSSLCTRITLETTAIRVICLIVWDVADLKPPGLSRRQARNF